MYEGFDLFRIVALENVPELVSVQKYVQSGKDIDEWQGNFHSSGKRLIVGTVGLGVEPF